MEPIVRLNNVYKTYSFYKTQSEKLLDVLAIKKKRKSFTALRGISFEVYRGESVGIIGINGSGKSTLSNLLAQIGVPTSGKVTLNGESSLIAIAAGLNNNLSGLENIRLKCLMMGLKNDEISKITPKIIEFADIGDFIYQPVKNYSSGMKSRLGFAISIHTNPDILIIDEALSVGDQTFYEKCIKRMEEFKSEGKTIFFISHSISQVRNFCDKVLWLHFGEIHKFGDSKEVLKEYKEFINWFNSLNEKEKKEYRTQKLQEQFLERKNELSHTRRNLKGKKKKNNSFKRWLFSIQILFLLLFLSITILLMFTKQDPLIILNSKSLGLTDNNIASNKITMPKANQIKKESINKKGLITRENVDMYSDPNFKNKIGTLSFASPVQIVEKSNNAYSINFDNSIGYIKANTASILENNPKVSDYNLQDIIGAAPKTFSSSYMFFMEHLGLSYNQVEKNIRGLSQEMTSEDGEKVQVYNYYNVEYFFDSTNLCNKMKILNINTDNDIIRNLESNAVFKDSTGNQFLTYIKDYEVIVNKNEGSMTIKTLNKQ
ncbi:teichoic acids export ABC transporter ATP-binding subunit TagH [Neobacillus cucumis]|uniref:teichoic acids export ABC transporter ATP-binding subunit TagH n=1 Tax=Neobacillus cucumis TaxID=1740721 RepID=UPI001963F799|nr:teichoic acids export ABC transporter ATP-binding subunit TagH [Neobacillus cucumis]MBM7652570.1 teichoic acid transport system ATP-binding protein [Neobacillus cucumis]